MIGFEFLSEGEEKCLLKIKNTMEDNQTDYYTYSSDDLTNKNLSISYIISLNNKGYIEGKFYDNSTRGLLYITAKGRDYFGSKENYLAMLKKTRKKEAFRFWLPVTISLASLCISLIALILK
jgi:hypothetical protein